MSKQRDYINTLEGTYMLADGYDDCIFGVSEDDWGNPGRVIYDAKKIIDKLCLEDDMDYQDAVEFYNFNIEGAYVGDHTPVFIWPIEHLIEEDLTYV